MKSIFLISVLGASLILAVACPDNQEYVYRQVYSIDSVRTQIQNSGKIILSVTATVPDPCYVYSHYKSARTDSVLSITPYAKRDKNVNCIQVLAKISFEIDIQADDITSITLNSLRKPTILQMGEIKKNGVTHE